MKYKTVLLPISVMDDLILIDPVHTISSVISAYRNDSDISDRDLSYAITQTLASILKSNNLVIDADNVFEIKFSKKTE